MLTQFVTLFYVMFLRLLDKIRLTPKTRILILYINDLSIQRIVKWATFF